MWKTFIGRLVKTSVVFFASYMLASSPGRRFTIEEVHPFLKVISTLHPVDVVDDSPYFKVAMPHICWLEAPAFGSLPMVLARYPGAGTWILIQQVPRMCLVAQPNIAKGESFPVDLEQSQDAKDYIAKLEDKLMNRGVAAPWKDTHFIDPEEFKARMVREIPKLALFTEEVLNLGSKLPLGVKMSDQNLELPLMKDRSGPGYGVILAADPVTYVSTRFSTSPFDRMLHFWITDDEANQLWSEISTVEAELKKRDERVGPPYPILSKVAVARYGGLE